MKLLRTVPVFLALVLSASSYASNCGIHVPVKDADLQPAVAENGLRIPAKYASIINGYELTAHSETIAPFNLLLNDVFKGDAKNIYTVELSHASGFRKIYHFTMTVKDWAGHVLTDFSNSVIEKKMSEAKTVAEFQKLKFQINPSKNKVIPPMTELEFILKQLPSCDKMMKN